MERHSKMSWCIVQQRIRLVQTSSQSVAGDLLFWASIWDGGRRLQEDKKDLSHSLKTLLLVLWNAKGFEFRALCQPQTCAVLL